MDSSGIQVDGHPLSNFRRSKDKQSFVNNKTKQRIADAQFRGKVARHIAFMQHRNLKTTEDVRRMKSSRAYVKQGKYGKTPVRIPKNNKDFHAETAIKNELPPNEQMDSVGGTKVACLACQGSFTKDKCEHLLGNQTSFAWLSESSMGQLGHGVGKQEDYMVDLQKTLQPRMNKLQFYKGKQGTISTSDMTMEANDDTDSEDEEAVNQFANDNDVVKHADDFADAL
jgi:hypothetical protein